MKIVTLSGKYGKLSILGPGIPRQEKSRLRTTSICACECGNIVTIRNTSIKSGLTISCGCVRSNNMKKIATKHGLISKHRKEYLVWLAMKQRCLNKNKKCYRNYGARGISFAKSWQDFSNFIRDMGPCPPGLTLDRINNDLGYSRENCRWADWFVQNRNKRKRRTRQQLETA